MKTTAGYDVFQVGVNIKMMPLMQEFKSGLFFAYGSKFSILFWLNFDGSRLMVRLQNESESGVHVEMNADEDFYGHRHKKITVGPKQSNFIFDQLLAFPGPGLLHYYFSFVEVNSFVSSQKVDEITTKVDAMNNKVNDMTTAMDDLKAKILELEKRKSPSCSVCLEDFTSTSKIAQCISGHLVCWNCNQKSNNRDCGLCGQPVNGRAFGMEQYLRT